MGADPSVQAGLFFAFFLLGAVTGVIFAFLPVKRVKNGVLRGVFSAFETLFSGIVFTWGTFRICDGTFHAFTLVALVVGTAVSKKATCFLTKALKRTAKSGKRES